jgi:hypothetical protein
MMMMRGLRKEAGGQSVRIEYEQMLELLRINNSQKEYVKDGLHSLEAHLFFK